jgi:hypothetical protein
MSRTVARVSPWLIVASLLPLTGCFTLAKQAYNEARGAQGEVLPISNIKDRALAEYKTIEFTPATTTVGSRICPPEVLHAYDRAARALQSRLKPLFPGGEPALKADSDVIYVQTKGILGGALMLTRIRLHAADELVIDALVRAESESFRAGGENDLAQASASALERFLEQKKRGPAAPRDGARERKD